MKTKCCRLFGKTPPAKKREKREESRATRRVKRITKITTLDRNNKKEKDRVPRGRGLKLGSLWTFRRLRILKKNIFWTVTSANNYG